jgi:membrane protein DedA with SNARE-associated domain
MHLVDIIHQFGYPVIFAFVMGETMGLPIPGETSLLIGSAAAGATGALSLWGVIAAGAAGAVIGDNMGYWVGRHGGRPLLLKLAGKLGLRDKVLPRAEAFFARHGGKTVFLGRFVVFLRILSGPLAGASRMPYATFLLYNLSGGVIWAAAVSIIGHFLGRNLNAVEGVIRGAGWGLSLLIVIVVALGMWWRHRRQS